MASKNKSGAYIREWMESVGLKQADLVKKLGWSKAKANSVWHGDQRYNEDMLNEVSLLVNARPRELLMHPADAHAERRLRATLREIAGGAQAPAAEAEEPAAQPIPLPSRRA